MSTNLSTSDLKVHDYLVVFKQAGQGCDYTIECGTLVIQVAATSTRQALTKALQKHGWRIDYDHFKDEYEMDSVTIYRIDEVNTAMWDEHLREVRAMAKRAQEADDLAEKRAEYERLKQLFES